MNIRMLIVLLFFTVSRLVGNNAAGIYKGTIGNSLITMHIFVDHIMKNGTLIEDHWLLGDRRVGYYYYDRYKKPIDLFLNARNIQDDTLEFTTAPAYDDVHKRNGYEKEKFIVSFVEDKIKGKWISKSGKVLTISARLNVPFIKSTNHREEAVFKFNKPPIRNPISLGTFSIEVMWPEGLQEINYLKEIIIEAAWPENSKALNRWFFQALRDASLIESELIDRILKEQKNRWHSWYLNQCCSEIKSKKTWISYCYVSSTIISIENLQHDDSGGAHGNYSCYFTVVDLLRKKKIKLEDVFTAKGIKALPDLLQKNCGEQYRKLMWDRAIPLTHNFYVTEKGISFCYEPYAIACGAAGAVRICIPFTKARECLNNDFLKLVDI